MDIPPKITFRNMEPSHAIDARIRQRVEKLEQMYGHLIGCQVAIEAPHRHQQQGKLYRVRVHAILPRVEVVAGRDPADHHAHEDVYVALRDAFDAVERRLEDYARRQRGAVKAHAEHPLAQIARLFREKGYGFLSTRDGREIYFHRNSVHGSRFDELELGESVRFVEGEGDEGPQATVVTPL